MILKVFFLGGGILRRPAAASVNRTTGATLRVEGVFCRPVALCSRHQCLYPELIPFFFVFFSLPYIHVDQFSPGSLHDALTKKCSAWISDMGYEFRFLLSSVFFVMSMLWMNYCS